MGFDIIPNKEALMDSEKEMDDYVCNLELKCFNKFKNY